MMPHMVIPASQKQLPSWDFYALQSLEFTENGAINKTHSVRDISVGEKHLVNERGQRRMSRFIQDNRKATNTQITAV
jgi:hypothetical protein